MRLAFLPVPVVTTTSRAPGRNPRRPPYCSVSLPPPAVPQDVDVCAISLDPAAAPGIHGVSSASTPLLDDVRGGGGHGGGSGSGSGSCSGGGGTGGSGYGGAGGCGDSTPPGWRLWLWPVVLLRRYLRLLDASPLRTKVWTSAALGAVSDLLAQAIESARGADPDGPGVNWRRVFALAVVGAVLTAPAFHYLYDVLERVLPVGVGGAGGKVRAVLGQLAVDQLVAAPLWLVGFFGLFGAVEAGRFDGAEFAAKLRRDYVTTLKLTWAVFPVFQLFSFALLPSNMRVLVLNFVDLGYTALLSMISHA
jgi:hypothetical protein